jgi:hypothetical protein
MSERGTVEVFLPVNRVPTGRREKQELTQLAFTEARKLVAPTGGKVLGLSKIIRAKNPENGELAYRVQFAVDAPESNFSKKSD